VNKKFNIKKLFGDRYQQRMRIPEKTGGSNILSKRAPLFSGTYLQSIGQPAWLVY